MIDIIDLHETNYNRNTYHYDAMKYIDKIFQKNKFPIIIGGTHYYTETILFD